LEGTFEGHLVQPPCNEQGHLQLDQVDPCACSDQLCFGVFLYTGSWLSGLFSNLRWQLL